MSEPPKDTTEVTVLDTSNPEIRVAARLLGVLQARLGEKAPKGVEVASHSADNVLFRFHYDPGKGDEGQQALAPLWIPFIFRLGGTGGSCNPHLPDYASVEGLINGVSLEKLDRAITALEQSGGTRGLGGSQPEKKKLT